MEMMSTPKYFCITRYNYFLKMHEEVFFQYLQLKAHRMQLNGS